ncbi:MAG: ComEC family competence protein [Cytophagales bacterium]|nr:MAG: ComEC family competence protein [Cytophagales bacterium]
MYPQIPFFKYAFFFASGIVSAKYFPISSIYSAYAIIASLTLAYVSILFTHKPSLDNSQTQISLSLIGMSLVFTIAFTQVNQNNRIQHNNHFSNFSSIEFIDGVISERPQEYERSSFISLDIKKIYTKAQWSNSSGKILIKSFHNGVKQSLKCGDILIVKGNPSAITNNPTINTFDTKGYYALQNIFHVMNVQSQFIRQYDIDYFYSIKRYSAECALYFEKIIDQFINDKDNAGISKALLLGNRTNLDKDLKKAYSNAGVIHVLAVSGLHVTILFGLFQFFFRKWMIGSRNKEKTGIILLLIILWIFAFITGLSASVIRAVVMFSIYLIALWLEKRNDLSNTVFASIFLMLLVNNNFIFDIGFQLSYLAVLGIIWPYQWLSKRYESSNKILNYIYQALMLSFCAQLFTSPIILFYFHQFPTYFLIANLLIVVLTNIVMVFLVALLSFSWLSPIASFIGKLTESLLYISNKIVAYIEYLPKSNIEEIHISLIQVLALYLLLLAIIEIVRKKKFHSAYWILIASLMYAGSAFYEAWKINKQRKLLFIADSTFILAHQVGSSVYFGTNYNNLSPNIKKELQNIGIKKFNVNKRNIQSSSLQVIGGMAFLEISYKDLYPSKIDGFKKAGITGLVCKNLSNKTTNIYWLKKNTTFPITRYSKQLHLSYITLNLKDIISIPITTK